MFSIEFHERVVLILRDTIVGHINNTLIVEFNPENLMN